MRVLAAVALLLALASQIATSTATDGATPTAGLSLRGACESKCAEQKAARSADCEEALSMAMDASFAATCQTESAREAEYCVAGCSVLGA